MAVPDEYRDHVMAKLAPLGEVKLRSMFGGYGIFAGEDMFALISGSALFFKVDDSNRASYEKAGSARYGPMPYFRVPPEVLDDAGALKEWGNAAISVAHATAKKGKKGKA